MLKTVRKAALLATVIGLASTAYAADPVIAQVSSYSFGTLSQSAGVSVGNPVTGFTGAFDNTFTFTQGSFPATTVKWSGIDVYGDLTLQYRVQIGATPWSPWNTPAAMPVASDSGSGAFSYSMTSGLLAQGQTYSFELKGAASQATYTVTLAPVPEPESWAMLLCGIGLMGFIARRRSNASLSA